MYDALISTIFIYFFIKNLNNFSKCHKIKLYLHIKRVQISYEEECCSTNNFIWIGNWIVHHHLYVCIFYVSDNNKINVDKEEIDKMINCDTFSWYNTEKCYVACMIYGDDDGDDVRNNMEKVYW